MMVNVLDDYNQIHQPEDTQRKWRKYCANVLCFGAASSIIGGRRLGWQGISGVRVGDSEENPTGNVDGEI
jgi:hypothetical protein